MLQEKDLHKVLLSLTKCVFCSFDFIDNHDDIVYSKFLDCYHTICAVCQNSWSEEETKQCPECQVVVHKNKLSQSTIFKEMVVTYKVESNKKFCGLHKEADAINWCEQCGDFVCSNCVQSHKLLKHTQNHVMKPTEQYKMNYENVPYYCNIHPKELLILHCLNCEKLTCRDCQLNEHRTHKYDFISNQIDSVKKEIFEKNLLLRYQAIIGNKSIQLIKQRRDRIHQEKTKIMSKIMAAYNDVIRELDRQRDQLIANANSIIKRNLAVLEHKEDKLSRDFKLLNRTISFTNHVLYYSSDSAIIQQKKDLLLWLDHTSNALDAGILNPICDIEFKFKSTSNFYKEMLNLGSIHSKPVFKNIETHAKEIAKKRSQLTQNPSVELLVDLEISDDEVFTENQSQVPNETSMEVSTNLNKEVTENENNPISVENDNHNMNTTDVDLIINPVPQQENVTNLDLEIKLVSVSQQNNIEDIKLNPEPVPEKQNKSPVKSVDKEKIPNKEKADSLIPPIKSPSLSVRKIESLIDKINYTTPFQKPFWIQPISNVLTSTSTTTGTTTSTNLQIMDNSLVQNSPDNSRHLNKMLSPSRRDMPPLVLKSPVNSRHSNTIVSPLSEDAPTLSLPNMRPTNVVYSKSPHVPLACMPTPPLYMTSGGNINSRTRPMNRQLMYAQYNNPSAYRRYGNRNPCPHYQPRSDFNNTIRTTVHIRPDITDSSRPNIVDNRRPNIVDNPRPNKVDNPRPNNIVEYNHRPYAINYIPIPSNPLSMPILDTDLTQDENATVSQ